MTLKIIHLNQHIIFTQIMHFEWSSCCIRIFEILNILHQTWTCRYVISPWCLFMIVMAWVQIIIEVLICHKEIVISLTCLIASSMESTMGFLFVFKEVFGINDSLRGWSEKNLLANCYFFLFFLFWILTVIPHKYRRNLHINLIWTKLFKPLIFNIT